MFVSVWGGFNTDLLTRLRQTTSFQEQGQYLIHCAWNSPATITLRLIVTSSRKGAESHSGRCSWPLRREFHVHYCLFCPLLCHTNRSLNKYLLNLVWIYVERGNKVSKTKKLGPVLGRRPGKQRSLGKIHRVGKLMSFYSKKEKTQGQDHYFAPLNGHSEAGVALYWEQRNLLLIGNFQEEKGKEFLRYLSEKEWLSLRVSENHVRGEAWLWEERWRGKYHIRQEVEIGAL